ncbi:MAG: right-handed parallel beta-helix repeat-containing protein [Planctomycetota bacterium]|jgi:parallel beta-helix repeat protein
MKSLLVFVPLALLVLAPVSLGDQQTTVPGGSVDAIAAAIQDVGPGGTVLLERGTHTLTSTVSVGIPSVTVTGRPGAKIVGRGSDAGGRLLLFRVEAAGFTLHKVRIEAATGHLGDLAVIEVVDSANASVTKCRAKGITQLVDGGAGAGLVVSRNRVHAVDVLETDAPAEHGAVIRSEGAGSVQVEKNRLEGRRGPGTVGVEILPPLDAVHHVTGNRIRGFEDGIAGEGPGRARVEKNRVRECGNGIILAQATTAADWEITSNHVRDAISVGIFLGDGDKSLVKGNRVLRAGTDGLNVGGVLLTVRDNWTRLDGGFGLFGESSASDYLNNTAKRCGSGIRVEGSGNRLGRNNASKNHADGVVSTGGNVASAGNRGRKNGGLQVSIE